MSQFDDDFDKMVGLPAGRPRRRRAQSRPTDYSKTTWTTNAGKTMLVAEMSVSHRQNSLNVLVRRHGKARVLDSEIGKAFLYFGATLGPAHDGG